MQEYRRLFAYVTPYWKHVMGALLGLIASSLITLAIPWTIRLLVDSVFVNRDYDELNRIGLTLLGLFVVQAFVSFAYRFMLQFITQRTVADLRLAVQRHLLYLPLRFFTNTRTGDIISRVSNDASVIQGVLTDAPVSLTRQIVTFGGGVILMFFMNWRLTLIILAIIPPVVLVATFYGRSLKRLSTAVQDRLADATIVLEETLSGVRVVKSFVREPYEEQRYAHAIEESFATAIKRARQQSIFIPLITIVGFVGMTVLIWVGGRQVIAGEITPGELISFLFYMVVVSAPVTEAASLWGRLQEALGAARRIFEIMDTAPEQAATPTVGALNAARSTTCGHVRFETVRFSYGDDADDKLPVVLHDVDLEAKPGQVIALVGYSGSGKSTLVNLIPRFYDPQSGMIMVDGVDTRQMNLADLRSQIGLVPQETFLFGGTVRENIAYGRLDASKAEIIEAAEAAYATEFISELPQQFDTTVGERGVKLSAGQRQRIAIARALLKNPRILILDEATSALDTESERWVQAALERLMEGRTSFVIAHRLSTVQRADCILVMEKGCIVERGRHAALLQHDGLYRRLHDMQFTERAQDWL